MIVPSSDRIVRLRERMPRRVRLTPADAAFLASLHRSHVELMPTTLRNIYRLTALGYVGVIVAPHCRLVVRPKIPLANLFNLLDPLGEYTSTPDSVTPTADDTVMNFLAGQLAHLLAKRGAVGLHRGYVEVEDEGPFLRGRLDVAAQLRDGPNRKDRLHSRDDSFTTDVPCNRLPRATAELLLAFPHLDDHVRTALRSALRPFAEVTAVPVGIEEFDCLLSRSIPEDYRVLLGLCRLLVGAMRPGEEAGPVPAPTILLNMERVFERYLTERLTVAFAGPNSHFQIVPQPRIVVSEPVAGQPDLTVRPDVVLVQGDRDRVIVDAKWKRLDGSPLVAADVYQMMAYCTVIGVQRGVLVYPGRRDHSWEYRLTDSPLTLTIRTLRVVGEGDELAASIARLARFLRRQAGAIT